LFCVKTDGQKAGGSKRAYMAAGAAGFRVEEEAYISKKGIENG
jgi:hypothetical protein